MSNNVLRGGCLCGAVRYEAAGASLKVANCHCSMCRRHSGAAFLTYAAFPKDSICFSGKTLAGHRSSKEAVRSHCANCGSPVTFVFDSDPETIWVTVGTLDFPDMIKPTENWYVADKLAWVALDDTLPQWQGAPD
ncbi:MAG: GFA family protein [Pseudomonadota bacterium]|nr:GFA family protein [Pseudomonadota bacterium]